MQPDSADALSAPGLLRRMAGLVADWQENAAALDAGGAFPATEFADLHAMGAYVAPLPELFGGVGLGTEPAGALDLLELLRLIGRGNLAVGRVFEGHVNALKLVATYGTGSQLRAAADDAAAGHLFAIWNTEPNERLRLDDGKLHGRKIFCSAAGYATRALVTAQVSDGQASEGQTLDGQSHMIVVPLHIGERVSGEKAHLQGMRACGTGSMDFDGAAVDASALIGQPGDYLRQPEFSAGAWRTSAVTLGGLEALVEAARRQLAARNRHEAPHQAARMGAALIAQETALLWVRKAAVIAERRDLVAEDVAGYVNLARIAVETACLDAMRAVQRSLGLAGFLQSNPVERMMRDLATYLRQPAPDETLDEAARWFMQRALPDA